MPAIGWLTGTSGPFKIAIKPNWERSELRKSILGRLRPMRTSLVNRAVGDQRQEAAKNGESTWTVVIGLRPKTEESNGRSVRRALRAKVRPSVWRAEAR